MSSPQKRQGAVAKTSQNNKNGNHRSEGSERLARFMLYNHLITVVCHSGCKADCLVVACMTTRAQRKKKNKKTCFRFWYRFSAFAKVSDPGCCWCMYTPLPSIYASQCIHDCTLLHLLCFVSVIFSSIYMLYQIERTTYMSLWSNKYPYVSYIYVQFGTNCSELSGLHDIQSILEIGASVYGFQPGRT